MPYALAAGNFLIPNMTFVVELMAFIIVLASVSWSFDDEHRHSGFTNEHGQFKFLVAHAHGRDRDVDANGEIVLRTVANLY